MSLTRGTDTRINIEHLIKESSAEPSPKELHSNKQKSKETAKANLKMKQKLKQNKLKEVGGNRAF